MSEQLGVSIRLFLTDGTPDGLRIVEKSNWSGVGLVFSRSEIGKVGGRPELDGPGVYILEGPSEADTFDTEIYIGESDGLLARLKSHHGSDNKEFWTRTIVFASRDGNLNKAHIRYIESRMVSLANDAKRSVVANVSAAGEPPLSEADRAEAEGFLRDILLILPVLGVNALERAQDLAAATTESDRPILTLQGKDAEGQGQERAEGFLVFEGSRARASEVPSIQNWGSRLRRALIEGGVLVQHGNRYHFSVDYLFDSPSAAAVTLLGRSANGRIEWRTSDGLTLKELQAREADLETTEATPL